VTTSENVAFALPGAPSQNFNLYNLTCVLLTARLRRFEVDSR